MSTNSGEVLIQAAKIGLQQLLREAYEAAGSTPPVQPNLTPEEAARLSASMNALYAEREAAAEAFKAESTAQIRLSAFNMAQLEALTRRDGPRRRRDEIISDAITYGLADMLDGNVDQDNSTKH